MTLMLCINVQLIVCVCYILKRLLIVSKVNNLADIITAISKSMF